jgi:Dolichyl-phosphate-mannose-protein mannosyltransferase
MICWAKFLGSFALGNSARTPSWWAVGLLVLVAFFYRGDQLIDQVLVDDEWHAAHQVMMSSPTQIATSFGLADYSIPLTLYYKAIANAMGLSEMAMRAPLFIAGLALVAMGVMFAWKRLGPTTAICFGALLVSSPLLFTYARIARPYGLTVLLVPLAIWLYLRWWQARHRSAGIAYVFVAVLATWLHLIVAPMVFAPQLWALWQVRTEKNGFSRWLLLAVASALVLIAVVGPPFLFNPNALAEKAATDSPTFATVWGAAHQWFGVGSRVIMVVMGGFVIAGAARVWRACGAFAHIYALGLLITCGAVFVMRPAWVHQPLTFARYLLPILPALLLCCAAGIARCAHYGASITERRMAAAALTASLVAATIFTTPMHEILRVPQHYASHSWFHLDVRIPKNPIRDHMSVVPISPLWAALTPEKIGPVTIAAAPWSLFSFDAELQLWQQIAKQKLIPASGEALCTQWEGGHPQPGKGLVLRNFAMLADDQDLRAKRVDVVVLRKPIVHPRRMPGVPMPDLSTCATNLTMRFGPPIMEDAVIQVFDLRRRYAQLPPQK